MENWKLQNPDAVGKTISFDYTRGNPKNPRFISGYRVFGYTTTSGSKPIEYIRLIKGQNEIDPRRDNIHNYEFDEMKNIKLDDETPTGGGKRKSRRNRKSKKTNKSKKTKKTKKSKKSTRRKR